MSYPIRLLVAVAALSLGSPSDADLLTGRVVDSTGVGVPGVDLDFKNVGQGGDPTPANDGTDAGGFFAVTIPAGTYDVTFTPPPPPTTSHLLVELSDVQVSGTTDIGTVSLPAGVAITGRVLDSSLVPVVGLDTDVVDLSTGEQLDLGPADNTNASGIFNIAVPAAPIELRFDTTTVQAQTLAPKAMDLAPTSDLNLGDVVLEPGFTISGIVRGPGAIPVADADLDAVDSASGQKLYTPGDNTDGLGIFSFTVAQGTYDFEVCPPNGMSLVGETIANVTVNGNVNLGLISLMAGVQLTGVVTSGGGAPVSGVDVDVRDSGTGAEITLCGDNTDSNGVYQVIVPTGTFDIEFSPSFSTPYGGAIQTSVGVGGGGASVNAVVPDCPFGVNYGIGLAGTGGIVPHLAMSGGAPRPGNDELAYELEQSIGGSFGLLVVGLTPTALPIYGGTLLVFPAPPTVYLPVFVGGSPGSPGAGSASFPFPLAIQATMVGLTIRAQFGIQDFGAIDEVSLSDGLALTLCP